VTAPTCTNYALLSADRSVQLAFISSVLRENFRSGSLVRLARARLAGGGAAPPLFAERIVGDFFFISFFFILCSSAQWKLLCGWGAHRHLRENSFAIVPGKQGRKQATLAIHCGEINCDHHQLGTYPVLSTMYTAVCIYIQVILCTAHSYSGR
jgi:hypothetical protein